MCRPVACCLSSQQPVVAFVRHRFARAERSVVAEANFLFRFPDAPGFVGVLARWQRGNADPIVNHEAPSSRARSIRAIMRRPSLWLDLPVFIVITALAKLN